MMDVIDNSNHVAEVKKKRNKPKKKNSAGPPASRTVEQAGAVSKIDKPVDTEVHLKKSEVDESSEVVVTEMQKTSAEEVKKHLPMPTEMKETLELSQLKQKENNAPNSQPRIELFVSGMKLAEDEKVVETEIEKPEEQVDAVCVDGNNNKDKKAEESEQKSENDEDKRTCIEVDGLSMDIPNVGTETSNKQPAAEFSAPFPAIRNVFTRFGGKKSTINDDEEQVKSKLLDYDVFDQQKINQQIAQLVDDFNLVLDEVRANKKRVWFILEHPGTAIPSAKLVEPEVAVSRLPREFRIRHLSEVLKRCRFDECPLTHVVMNVACGFVSTFDTSKVDADHEFKGVLKETAECLHLKLVNLKSVAVLVCPSSPQFSRFNNTVNSIIEREVRNLNNYVFNADKLDFIRFVDKEDAKPEVLAESWMKELEAYLQK